MTLTLTSTYAGHGGLRAYYANRALRLLPLYAVCLAAGTALLFANGNATREAWRGLRGGSVAVAAALQALPLGQELFHWLEIRGGALAYTPAFHESASQAWHLLVLPTCWSLSIEGWFYLVAPWVVRRGLAARAGLAAASFGVWGLVLALRLAPDPWIYRFFPATLAFFVAGSLVRTLHERHAAAVERALARPALLAAGIAALFAAIVGWRLAALAHPGTALVAALVPLYAAVVAALPFLFRAPSLHPALAAGDRFLAGIAYPVFLLHYPLLRLTGWTEPLAVLAASAAAGAAAWMLVDVPLARFKRRPAQRELPSASRT
ncbi:MAG: hypothetical protein IT452_10160 [Planctomycetia bacterium]|nr:hypothetical protein [Planctomycetia bacterium]